MRATGFSPFRLARPVLVFGLVTGLLTGALTVVINPMAQARLADRQSEIARTATARLLQEGQFLSPIAGVTLEAYAQVSKGIAAFGYDTTKLVDIAAGLGISASDWALAQEGWGARIQADRAVGSRFNELYTAL